MITDTQLKRVMPHLPDAKLVLYLPHLNAAMLAHGVDTMLRTAAFVAQLAHESAELRYMEEIWGPTEAQRRYEPPGELARRLGNSEPGDGFRFKGRGPIQITGRANYKTYGEMLGTDLVAQPQLAAQPDLAFETAALFWESNGLNTLADAGEFVTITRRINGGIHGLAEREAYYASAKSVLGDDFIAGDWSAPRSRTRSVPRAASALPRGHEAIVETIGTAVELRPADGPQQRPAVRKLMPKPSLAKAEARKSMRAKPVERTTAIEKGSARKASVKKPASKKTGERTTAARHRATKTVGSK